MTPQDQLYREPLRTTLTRTGLIALIVGALVARRWGGLARWPVITLLALWPSFGGHWVELAYLNHLRPRLPNSPALRAAARIAVWFLGGIVLLLGMELTATAMSGGGTGTGAVSGGGFPPARWPAWWLGGFAFIAIELVVHLVLELRERPSFYNGRG